MRAEHRPSSNGFTLLEVLVVLAVFSLAALALLRVQGVSLTGLGRLDDKLLAMIEVQNLAAEVRLARPAPAYGRSEGERLNASRSWRWQQEVARTPDPGLQQIRLKVSDTRGQTLAETLVVRPAS